MDRHDWDPVKTNQIEPIEQEGKTSLLRTHISNDRRPGNKRNYISSNQRQQSLVGSRNVRLFGITESKFNYRNEFIRMVKSYQRFKMSSEYRWRRRPLPEEYRRALVGGFRRYWQDIKAVGRPRPRQLSEIGCYHQVLGGLIRGKVERKMTMRISISHLVFLLLTCQN